ncbi:TylF/MycF/NovP-related O-methyltransferase [Meridianimarinicoccus sp. MJW13]|uniref:class I SAM-dependent methyltransferase n=1 Tax=Meridianimarinicoccus sp. MJW13 TaxID=2720031 RepID=UPI001868DE4A|nr:TylF/MycF/NovP-related O-methyltransferase [Fluviibacterium sp. MJW13]
MRYPDPFEAIWEKVKPFTMTSRNRGFALYEAVNHVIDNRIPGAFVECGVWRGGSSMIIALTLLERGVTNRAIRLFDTFEGMTEPSDEDRDPSGRAAADILKTEAPDGLTHAACDLATVRANMISTGYPRNRFAYVKGDVRKTLPCEGLGKIALLRLDTDFFDSTQAELIHLYPKVSPHGVVIVDDYGHWQGARKAVDAFLEKEKAAGRPHFLTPLDYTGRLFVKPQPQTAPPAPSASDLDRRDYISKGLRDPGLVGRFSYLEKTDPMPVKWPYLRRHVAQVWRTDARASKPNIGVLSVDEGAVLYNAALPFKGRRGLEIGCHMGFSTAHLLAAGLDLDVIDPALGDAAHLVAVHDNLDRAVPGTAPRLHAGFSPGIVKLVHAAKPRTKWRFAFIDGLHDGTAPLADARAVEPFMADTAAVMFHDLVCPDVAQALHHYADAGWQTRIYETMQVMGIAWRGNYTAPAHVPDAGTSTAGIDHLARWHPAG